MSGSVGPPAQEDVDATPESQQPKRRKLTERRRAQNREAQRLFRERKRKKLFDNISQSTEPEYWGDHNNASSATDDPISNTPDPLATSLGTGVSKPTVSLPLSKENELNEVANQIYNLDARYANRKFAKRGIRAELVSLNWLLNNRNDPIDEVLVSIDNVSESGPCIPATEKEAVDGILVEVDDIDDADLGLHEDITPVIREEHFTSSLNMASEATYSGATLPDSSAQNQVLSQTATSEFGEYTLKDIIKAGLEALSAKEKQVDIRISGNQRIWDSGQWNTPLEFATEKLLQEMLTRTPTPWKTSISLHEISTMRACVINAKSIGFWNPLPSDFKDPFKSPFVQSYFLNDRSVETVQQKYSHVAGPLQPRVIQCKTPHRPYIDLLPFPVFRERLIAASNEGWGSIGFDENELCNDLAKSALICWGGGYGENGGEAWNPRSWEAKPWFLKKWSMLVDEDMKESSRWWRNMRDDESEDLEEPFIAAHEILPCSMP
ncbi:hypothetical protein ABW20_dc0102540 [Dactylellina cionopaga]|nr:hypothetical protein ABW20_dc0102540 [Dactylellina cionopaga]